MKKFSLFAIYIMACLLAGCEPKVTEQKPTVITEYVTEVQETSALVTCNVTNDGGAIVTERGVVYSLYPNPKPSDSSTTKIKNGSGTGKYSCNLTELQSNYKYYVRAYAINEVGIEYGKEISFITLKKLFLPTVSTDNITDILTTSAIVTGSIISDGGAYISESGIVYNTSENPTISNNKVLSSERSGTFQCNLTDLQEQTTYYVRAYAINEKGVAYGEEKSFTTQALSLPTVSLSSIANISYTSAIVTGEVSDDGKSIVSERGVVYSTSQNPTTSDYIVQCGSGLGTFTCDLKNLDDNTTYYIRVYAINEKGISYSNEEAFKTKDRNNGGFSVEKEKMIKFSIGNLQYHKGNNEWRFAENQTDYIGEANKNAFDLSGGWLDLFYWSSSETSFGVFEISYSQGCSDCFVDWGANTIGTDAPNTWRTLTISEWEYLCFTRVNARSLYGAAQVNGVNGVILLPDNWTCPDGVTFKSGFCYGMDSYAEHQTFTAVQWSKLEAAGAIFLPASGYRNDSEIDDVQYLGYYWSATEDGKKKAKYLQFYRSGSSTYGSEYRSSVGYSVRLVKDL